MRLGKLIDKIEHKGLIYLSEKANGNGTHDVSFTLEFKGNPIECEIEYYVSSYNFESETMWDSESRSFETEMTNFKIEMMYNYNDIEMPNVTNYLNTIFNGKSK